jgi:hypothetical protein
MHVASPSTTVIVFSFEGSYKRVFQYFQHHRNEPSEGCLLLTDGGALEQGMRQRGIRTRPAADTRRRGNLPQLVLAVSHQEHT